MSREKNGPLTTRGTDKGKNIVQSHGEKRHFQMRVFNDSKLNSS